MRWIFVSLMLLNAGYFGWEWAHKGENVMVSGASLGELPLEGPKLVLVTERLPDSSSALPPPSIFEEKEEPIRRQVDVVEIKRQDMCPTVGPFATQQIAEEFISTLKKEEFETKLQSLEVEAAVQFWVLVPSLPTRKEAMVVLRDLQAKKIDSYLIASGEMKNAISLGLFNKELSAKGVLTKMSEAGIDVEIRQKPRIETEFWVSVRAGQPIDNIQETLQSLGKLSEEIKISKTSCEMFALAE